ICGKGAVGGNYNSTPDIQTRDAQSFFPESIRKKSAVIMNQVDKRFFNIKRGTGEYWLATGRLEKQKNYPLMITAFANVCRRHPDEVLKIYGEGSEKESLRRLIKQLGMEHNILLMGVTNDVPQQLKNAKGFILSSDYEGMPNGLLEALAAGVPCIATDCPCGGPREVIHTGINGVLVSINNKIELESAIEKILCDPEFSNRLEINAREMALKFNPVNILGDWTDYIRKVRCE
ncbi:MAG: glycosyltransferase, partial [Eubacteriales bacterium]|nr:glycosyltransferase [Eubacteriales bacterium]